MMQVVNLISLVLLALVFALWATAMFFMLWRLSQRAAERLHRTGGGYVVWARHSLAVFLGALTSDKDRLPRRRIVILTGLLVVTIVARSLLIARLS